MRNLTPRYLLPLSMINEVNRGFMDDVSQHNLFSCVLFIKKPKGVEKKILEQAISSVREH